MFRCIKIHLTVISIISGRNKHFGEKPSGINYFSTLIIFDFLPIERASDMTCKINTFAKAEEKVAFLQQKKWHLSLNEKIYKTLNNKKIKSKNYTI